MSSRRLRLLVLGFACLWFGMLMPVHQRGQIKLPGVGTRTAEAGTSAAAAHCSRASDPTSACHKQRQQQAPGQQGVPESGGADCAVCHFIAGLHAPPPPLVCEARLGLLETLPVDQPVAAAIHHRALPFHGLDPPLA